MKTVNIYIAVSVKGPRRQEGKYGYILEMPTARPGNPITLTNVKKLPEPENNTTAVLTALEESLKRIKEPCYLTIYTDSDMAASALCRGWLEEWKNNGWRNKKNKPICDVAKWRSIEYLLNAHEVKVALKHTYSYREWLEREVCSGDRA